MQEHQDDERNAQGVEEHQHRNRGDDDGLQPKQTNQVAHHREDEHPLVVGELLGELMKVGCRAANQANSCRQAGKDHHGRQKQGTFVAKEDLGAFGKNRSTCFLHADCGDALSSDLGNEDVDQGKKNAGNHAGLKDFRGNFCGFMDAVVVDGSDHKRSKDKRCDGVKRVVTIKNALHDGFARSCIGFARRRHLSHRSNVGLNDENDERENKCWREHFADAIDQLGGRHGKPHDQSKEDHKEDRKPHLNMFWGQEWSDGDFKSHSTRSWSGKARTNGKITDHGVKDTPVGVHAGCDRSEASRAGICNSHDAQKGKTNASDAKAKKRPPDVFAGGLSHRGRKDQVACAKEKRKEHEADWNVASFAALLLHLHKKYVP